MKGTPLSGRTVVVTGGSRGIGRATAVAAARAGADLVLVARTADTLAETARLVRDTGRRATAYALDLRDLPATEALATRVTDEVGLPDVVVLNAGHSVARGVLECAGRFDTYERLTTLNYLSPLAFLGPLLPLMAERGSGHVIGVTSATTRTPVPGWGAYTASKAALDSWLRSARPELASAGIDVTVCQPPLVDTDMIRPVHGRSRWAIPPERVARWLVGAMVDPVPEVGPWYVRPGSVAVAAAPYLSARVLGALSRRRPRGIRD